MSFNNPPFRTLADLNGLRVTIMGLGLNGGGLSSARFFAEHGARVTVTDRKTASDLEPSIAALADLPDIRFVLGTHELADFQSADMVIKNPGVRIQGNEFLAAARSIETDISVFLRLSAAPLLAVTGSKGKSSTVSAMYHGLKELGYPAFLGGNITVSPLTFLHRTGAETPVVLELSSWQLADLKGRGLLKPKVAVLTPIMADHQNWYGGMEPYVADKRLIFADQDKDCFTICNYDDEWGQSFARETKAQVRWYSTRPLDASLPGCWLEKDGTGYYRREANAPAIPLLPATLAVPGAHMRQNLLNAAAALVLYGADPKRTAEAMAGYPGIAHRLEFFHEYKGLRFYNDSAATIPEAAAAALEAFDAPVILLCGGTDKELDFTALANVAARAKRLVLLAGTGTDKLIIKLREKNIDFSGPHPDLETLLEAALTGAEPGDVLLFSPGATSFGLFKNEFDRGNRFRDLVKQHLG